MSIGIHPPLGVAARLDSEEDEPRSGAEPTERVEPECVTAPAEGIHEDTGDHDQPAGDESCGGPVVAAR